MVPYRSGAWAIVIRGGCYEVRNWHVNAITVPTPFTLIRTRDVRATILTCAEIRSASAFHTALPGEFCRETFALFYRSPEPYARDLNLRICSISACRYGLPSARPRPRSASRRTWIERTTSGRRTGCRSRSGRRISCRANEAGGRACDATTQTTAYMGRHAKRSCAA